MHAPSAAPLRGTQRQPTGMQCVASPRRRARRRGSRAQHGPPQHPVPLPFAHRNGSMPCPGRGCAGHRDLLPLVLVRVARVQLVQVAERCCLACRTQPRQPQVRFGSCPGGWPTRKHPSHGLLPPSPSLRPTPPNSRKCSPTAVKEWPERGQGTSPVVLGTSQKTDCSHARGEHGRSGTCGGKIGASIIIFGGVRRDCTNHWSWCFQSPLLVRLSVYHEQLSGLSNRGEAWSHSVRKE